MSASTPDTARAWPTLGASGDIQQVLVAISLTTRHVTPHAGSAWLQTTPATRSNTTTPPSVGARRRQETPHAHHHLRADTDPPSSRDPTPTAALLAAVLGFFVVTLDAVVANLALPSIRNDLGGGVAGLQWIVDGYTLMSPRCCCPPAR